MAQLLICAPCTRLRCLVPQLTGSSDFIELGIPTVYLNRSVAHPSPLSGAAHSMLFVNNLDQNGSHKQRSRFLPGACDGSLIGGMCMSEPGAGISKRLQDKARHDMRK